MLLTTVFLAGSLQVDMLEGPGQECQCSDVQGTGGPLGKPAGSMELPK